MGHVKHGLIEWTLTGVILELSKPLFHLSSKIYRKKESEMENESEGTVSKMAVWCGSGRVRACGRAARRLGALVPDYQSVTVAL